MAKSKFIGTIRIDVTKIDKSAIYVGKAGKYVTLAVFENDEPDQWGNDGFAAQDIPKERRDAGERGPILGNLKWRAETAGQKATEPTGGRQPASSGEDDDDIPF